MHLGEGGVLQVEGYCMLIHLVFLIKLGEQIILFAHYEQRSFLCFKQATES